MGYVLSHIDYIMKDTSHIHEAIEAIRHMDISQGPSGSDGSRGEAISHAVQSRETTNQQVLKLLGRMYDDLKILSESEEQKKVRALTKMLENVDLPPEEMGEAVQSIIQKVFNAS